jgi:uncharacterized protein YqfB (UPF0267 family)
MPALNFKKQFAALVESGKKRQSIRATRKRPFVPGDTLYLYTGMRTKNCRLLKVAVAVDVHVVAITLHKTTIDGINLEHGGLRAVAAADGFSCVSDFMEFFINTHGLPFSGQLIRW